MALYNTDNGYGSVAKIFHWLIFALVTLMIVGGLSVDDMPVGPDKAQYISIHKTLGITVFLLMWLRLFWRWSNPVPKQPGNTAPWQLAMINFNHVGLYVLTMAQPVSGVLMSQAEGHPVTPFGLFTLPTMIRTDKVLGETLANVHSSIWVLISVFAAWHITAAIYHHVVLKDNLLRRITVD